MNFINDDSIKPFFEKLIFSGKVKLRNLFINQNNISTHTCLELYDQLKENENQLKIKLFVDKFEKINYYREDRLKETIWFGPVTTGTLNDYNSR